MRNLSYNWNVSVHSNPTITFACPRGLFDGISLNCTSLDQCCSNESRQSIGKSSNCSAILMSSIVRGVNYSCVATTSKTNFTSVTSQDAMTFSSGQPCRCIELSALISLSLSCCFPSDLRAIDAQICNGTTLESVSLFAFNVSSLSDFQSIASMCQANDEYEQDVLCGNLTTGTDQCSTRFSYEGVLGCNYKCHFVTRKPSYADKRSCERDVQLGACSKEKASSFE